VTICVGLGRVRRQRLCAFELLRGGIRSPLRGSSPTCSASPVSVGRVGLQVQPIIEPVLCGTPGSLTLGLRFDSSWDENDSRSGRDPLSTSIPGATCGGPHFFFGVYQLGIVSKRLGLRFRAGRSPDWLKMKNPAVPAVKREAGEDWGHDLIFENAQPLLHYVLARKYLLRSVGYFTSLVPHWWPHSIRGWRRPCPAALRGG
jgi:hypothetical protein